LWRIKALTLLALVLLITGTVTPAPPHAVLPDGAPIALELAISDQERATGLMFRDQLAENRGMLFLFAKEEPWGFYMKNCFLSLDMIWLDSTGKIVHIEENVPPCKTEPCPTYMPLKPALAVLEVGAGIARKHTLKVGNSIQFSNVPGYPVLATGKKN
jgi:uncharacterized membrane protein (UPF0127 family)